jgi:hypothetical protein
MTSKKMFGDQGNGHGNFKSMIGYTSWIGIAKERVAFFSSRLPRSFASLVAISGADRALMKYVMLSASVRIERTSFNSSKPLPITRRAARADSPI